MSHSKHGKKLYPLLLRVEKNILVPDHPQALIQPLTRRLHLISKLSFLNVNVIEL